MSDLIIIKYDEAAEAEKARAAMKELAKQGLVSLDDAAVLSRGEDGKLHVHNEVDKAVKWGTVIGGGLGLILAGPFAPIAGAAVGGLFGAAAGTTMGLGIERKFVKEVGESLETGASALFIVVRSGNTNAILSTLRQFKGEVFQTTLSSEADEELRKAVAAGPQQAAEASAPQPEQPEQPDAPAAA